MFRKIGTTIRYPDWAGEDSRYRRLDLRDRLLEGTFYNHLNHAFYDETDQGGAIIPLVERRPSAQYRLPRMVARWASRKLFAGRHAPKVRHTDKKKATDLNALLRKGKFFAHMKAAALLGSVGAVAVTFRVEMEGQQDPKLALQIWRAKYCQPSFDEMGELAQLRVAYTTTGAALISMGATGLETGKEYWYIRDWLPTGETTFQPVRKADWNPVQGFVGEGAANRALVPWADQTMTHGLGFVCAQWFVNLGGGHDPDGACTFEDAIPNSIELDYTLSQIGRGTRYNASPQLVTIGAPRNGSITRGPMTHLEMPTGYKEDEITYGAGDAKLLEMSGTGTTAALALIDHLRNMALEQIAASRKDPDKMKAPLSGRAMEYLDQDSDDLVYDLRDQYGEHGALPLIKKIVLAAKIDKDASGITLQWPRMFQPTPDEVKALVESFQIALDPLKRSAPAVPATPAQPAGAAGGPGKPGTPEVPAVVPGEDEQLLTMQEARAYLSQVLDLSMLDMDDEESEQASVRDSPTGPDDPTPMAPPALSVDVNDAIDTPAENPDGPAPFNQEVGNMHIGSRVEVDA